MVKTRSQNEGPDATGTAAGLASVRQQDRNTADDFDYSDTVEELRTYFKTGATRSLQWRTQQLKQLRAMITDNMDRWCEALNTDLGRHPSMAIFGDLNSAIHSCDDCIAHVQEWSADRAVSVALEFRPGKAFQRPEPKGVLLNIAPWNFPVELVVSPMANMLAAGNCVVVKPSEMSPAVAQCFEELIPQYLDTRATAVVCGGVPETTALLKCKFDHILYTGNGFVAKIVMIAAAQHLCPVTLELGGKSPVILDQGCDVRMAARRLLSVKGLNCGQICLAPDYVLVNRSLEEQFYAELLSALKEFYPDGQGVDPSYGKIVNERHWGRLAGLMEKHGGEVLVGGADEGEQQDRFFPTTVIKRPSLDAKIMTEEIFGPILPVTPVDNLDHALEIINKRDTPLGLYIFTENQATIDYVLARTESGGVTVNDTAFHVLVDGLPFGGKGPSGLGAYHGQRGFDEFSHLRSIFHRGPLGIAGLKSNFDGVAMLRYPPHNDQKTNILRMMATKQGPVKAKIAAFVRFLLKVVLPVVLAYLAYKRFKSSA